MSEISYLFNREENALFTDVYFPKRAAYYGAIFDALRFGHDQEKVKEYLRLNIPSLLEEFRAFPDLFNPHRYTTTKTRREPVSPEEALERIEMYQSFFTGWSTNTVDGVFFGKDNKLIEEATQVVKIIFRLKGSFTKTVDGAGCQDVLRAIFFWILTRRGRLQDHKAWDKAEQNQFIARHEPWPKPKRAFVKEHFQAIAQEIAKWIDDRALFVFCYLARNFWEKVIKEKLSEEEIWITSFFNLTINVIEEIKR